MEHYNLIRSNRKTISIQINRDADVIVRAPKRAPAALIERFLREKEAWIAEKRTEMLRLKQAREDFDIRPGDSVLYLGRPYEVQLHSGRETVFNGSCFLIPRDACNVKAELIACYRQLALRYLSERAERFAQRMGVSPASVSITAAKTRWGSCSSKGRIHFSFLLIMAPPDAVDYVVVHELAHLLEMNHSARFWNIVAGTLPDYAQRRQSLTKLQELLSAQNWSVSK
ncbi:M48 family metallopeptidase [Candidatus Soleaferrea massiliensis]|uniref:M48 family metallopeptidase n=1 Tax=Candidatus Soleaferrea massiliensis TaxID=1470354 RepID=UPI000693A95E|nr:SprT family zinc-dependent metalloprotease [Candidatus Soleaferrea massiliensis]